MKTKSIMERIEPPRSVEEVVALSRYGEGVSVEVRPILHLEPPEPGRKTQSFRLDARFTARVAGVTSAFEKTCAKGHEAEPREAAANGFIIANTRVNREVAKLRKAGVKCEVKPFVLSELLPGTDLSGFAPKKPYDLDQFAVLAGIGVEVGVSMSTHVRAFAGERGKAMNELIAVYDLEAQGRHYSIETHHGVFADDADEKTRKRVMEVALYRLEMEQHKLRRVGAPIDMGEPWRGKQMRSSFAVISSQGREEGESGRAEKPLLQVV